MDKSIKWKIIFDNYELSNTGLIRNFKKFGQYENGVLIKEWTSVKEAGIKVNNNPRDTNISNCLNGVQRSFKGYTWKFLE